MSYKYAKLNAVGFGLAWGLVSAILLCIFGLSAMSGYGATYVTLLASVYFGYGASILGAIIGAMWGFLYGFVIGWVVAALYNNFTCRCAQK